MRGSKHLEIQVHDTRFNNRFTILEESQLEPLAKMETFPKAFPKKCQLQFLRSDVL